MADSSSSLPASKSPRSFWRFSLRALLIFFTLVCVGVWYWYRVPFEKEVVHAPQGFYWREKAGPVVPGKEIQRYRRVLRGEPIREGRTDHFDASGNRIGEEHWREDALHGVWVRWFMKGGVRQKGQYESGRKLGLWEQFDESAQPVTRIRYDRGFPHGLAEFFVDGQRVGAIEYDQGEAKQVDSRTYFDPLGRACQKGAIDHLNIPVALWLELHRLDFSRKSLEEAIDILRETFRIPIEFDRHSKPLANGTSNLTVEGAPLHSLLVLLLEPHGLVATYRFGAIWITTKEEAPNWADRTGVSKLLVSSPRETSSIALNKLRASMETPVYIDFVDVPAQEAAQYFADQYRVSLACDELLKQTPITFAINGVSLQNGLGALCDQNGLRIRWKDGTALLIEPQESR